MRTRRYALCTPLVVGVTGKWSVSAVKAGVGSVRVCLGGGGATTAIVPVFVRQ